MTTFQFTDEEIKAIRIALMQREERLTEIRSRDTANTEFAQQIVGSLTAINSAYRKISKVAA